MKGIGIDRELLEELDKELAIKRIQRDILSDFIFAPHYSIIFHYAEDEVFEQLKSKLQSGKYSSRLPISINVIKPNGFNRKGTILEPIDRLAYQLIVDLIAKEAESEIDRNQVFSNVLITEDTDGHMFEKSNESYENFKNRVQELCQSGTYQYVLKADIASYFDKIYQHIIGNLLKSSNAENKAVTFLERFLLQLSQNDSHGIIQGVFPSDFLGNFALCDIDAQHSIQGLEFARYVDDMYIFFPSLNEARIHKVRLSNWVREDGLTLNESKTKIFKVEELLNEETEIDKLFEAAKEEVLDGSINIGYETDVFWDLETNEEIDEDGLNLEATKNLFLSELGADRRNKIDRFCLPIFSAFESDFALDYVLENFSNEPSMSHTYFGYLRKMIVAEKVTIEQIEELLKQENLIFDYQKKWFYATLLYFDEVNNNILKLAVQDLMASEKNVGMRALCAIILGKNGSSAYRRILKMHYGKENSEYVKSAILYASQYFPNQERDTCYKAWAGHSETNTLIVKALKNKASGLQRV